MGTDGVDGSFGGGRALALDSSISSVCGEEVEDGHRRLQEEKSAMRTETAQYWRAWRSSARTAAKMPRDYPPRCGSSMLRSRSAGRSSGTGGRRDPTGATSWEGPPHGRASWMAPAASARAPPWPCGRARTQATRTASSVPQPQNPFLWLQYNVAVVRHLRPELR
jgi:hypothetical protein